MKIVLDTSSLILLAKVGMLGIVIENFECSITEDVKRESTYKKDPLDAKIIEKLIMDKKIAVKNVKSPENIENEFRLGKGEASSIAFALDENNALATDDKAAMKACKVLGIEFVTTIDFVLKAREKGEITREEAKIKITKLSEYGWYSTEIIKTALEKIGDENEQNSKSKAG